MKNLFVIAVLFACNFCFGQSLKQKLSKVETIEQANDFIFENQEKGAEFLKITSENANSKTENKLLNTTSKELIIIEKHIYKLISTDKEASFRASYIYFDGKKMNLNEINTLRKKIISSYQEGISFQELSKKYSMDPYQNADMGWFVAGETIPEFENAVKNHKKGEIFTVDAPEEQRYYIVLKTHDNTTITSKSFIRINNY